MSDQIKCPFLGIISSHFLKLPLQAKICGLPFLDLAIGVLYIYKQTSNRMSTVTFQYEKRHG